MCGHDETAEFRLKVISERATQLSDEDDLAELRTALENNERHLEMLQRAGGIATLNREIIGLIDIQEEYLALIEARIEQVEKEKRREIVQLKKELKELTEKEKTLPDKPREGQSEWDFDIEVDRTKNRIQSIPGEIRMLEYQIKGRADGLRLPNR